MSMSIDYAEMPYGIFAQRNFVWIFNRRYQPIAMTRWLGCTLTPRSTRIHVADFVPVEPAVWVNDIVGQVYFYRDGTSPKHDRKTRAELKRLLAAYPALARQGVQS